ncbi:hypothetical protein OpiT1DRAFT_00380 [Opitutaceae bacterium TAV1]|nr:hypothetical protein OpiT1DRAFT_00380 [Opitutaceae bacterium TAV1]
MIEARRQQLLHRIVNAWDRVFDPATGCLPSPRTAGKSRCPETLSLHYALALLETSETSRRGRAESVIARVLDRQVHAALIAPLALMGLLLIWHRHRRRLMPDLQRRIKDRLLHDGAACVPLPTPARMDEAVIIAWIQIAAAELGDDCERLESAVHQCMELRTVIFPGATPGGEEREAGGGDESGMALAGLHAMAAHIRHPGVLRLVARLRETLWEYVAGRLGAGLESAAGDSVVLAVLFERTLQVEVPEFLPEADPVGLLHALIVDPGLLIPA